MKTGVRGLRRGGCRVASAGVLALGSIPNTRARIFGLSNLDGGLLLVD